MQTLLEWRKQDLRRITQDINEWKKELVIQRLLYKCHKNEELLDRIEHMPDGSVKAHYAHITEKSLSKNLKKLYHTVVPKKEQGNMKITDDQIQRAREYDISLLFPDAKNGVVLCPFHPDSRPSASIKKGFFHCYVCGENADAIKVLMKRDGMTFTEAVIRLG